MSAQRNDLSPQITLVNVGTLAASAVLPGPRVERGRLLQKARLINQVGLAADDTNYFILKLMVNGVQKGIWSTKLTGGNGPLVANTAVDLGVADLDLVAADQITIDVTKAGTGVPTLAQVQLEWYPK